MRRLVAAGGTVVFLILVVVLIKGCVDNGRTQGLKDYNRKVTDISSRSVSQVSKPLFAALSSAGGKSAGDVQQTLNQLRDTADSQLGEVDKLDVPDAMKSAQQNLVLTMSLRRDGVRTIADQIQPALSKSASSQTAVNAIAGQMRAFDAADVVYSQRVAPLILKGLKDGGIAASYDGSSGEQVTAYSSFLPSIAWISPAYVGSQLGSSGGGGSSDSGPLAPGTHGHTLDSVSVGGTTLTTGGSNSIPANPLPTFTVNFTNSGQNNETNVKVDVVVKGNGQQVSGTATVPSTTAGEKAQAEVKLTSAPPTSGPSTIEVTVEKVRGETNVANNTLSFPALFTP